MSQTPLVFVHGSLGLGGAEVLRLSVLEELAARGVPARVCILRDDGVLAGRVRELGFPVDALGNKGGLFDVTGIRRLAHYFQQHGTVIAQASQFLTNLHTRIAASLAGVPVTIIEEHGLYSWKRWRHRALDRLICSRADAVVACSQSVADFATNNLHISPTRAHVIHNCAAKEHFSASLADRAAVRRELVGRDPSFLVGVVGTLRWEKGHRHLLMAWDQLHRSGSLPADADLAIIGSGPLEKELQTAFSDVPNVCFIGSRSDTARVLRALDLFVLPSVNEGFGIAILEAMCAELPILSTTSGGIPEVIDADRTGILVTPGEAEPLAQTIAKLYSDSKRRAQLGRAARQEAELRFHPRTYVDELLRLHASVLQKKGIEPPTRCCSAASSEHEVTADCGESSS